MDRALVIHIDSLCDRLVATPSQLEPDEVFLDESDKARSEMEALHGDFQYGLSHMCGVKTNIDCRRE